MGETRAVTAGHRACFEAGISLGSIFHQFVGTPVDEASAPSLERAIEESIEHQIGTVDVDVDITIHERNRNGFAFLTGDMLELAVRTVYEGREVVASMSLEDGYPLMRVDSLADVD